MDIVDFYYNVSESDSLDGLGIVVDDGDASVVIKHKDSGIKTKVTTQAILDNSWDDLCPILTGQCEPTKLTHMTRVVGYYSMVSNFNPSKVGELKDRMRGNYAIDGSHTSRGPRISAAEAIGA
jgi:hypothetical protein